MRVVLVALVVSLGALLLACGGASDGAHESTVEQPERGSSVVYRVSASEPEWVIPSQGLPSEVVVQPSNNNVDIVAHDGALFLAWRTGPTHFADEAVQMPVVRSDDGGKTWAFETIIDLDADLRRASSLQGTLQLIFFEAVSTPSPLIHALGEVFSPDGLVDPEILFEAPEVPGHQGSARCPVDDLLHRRALWGRATMDVLFRRSEDGESWSLVDGADYVYRGGVSEAAIEFDAEGGLWIVTRNEDGDASGYGSHVCYAPPGELSAWECPELSDPERYDSPELFRHGDEIYLVARRDVGGPYGPEGDILAYSDRPKRSALYRINQEARAVEHLMDLPGAGDTAFGAIQPLDEHNFLLANYTSPLDSPDISWIEGQTSERGTQIYLLTLSFTPEEP